MSKDGFGSGSHSKTPPVRERAITKSASTREERQSWLRRLRDPLESFYITYILELLLRQKALPPSRDGRHVPLHAYHDTPLIDERRGHVYISNTIRSSRYTVWNFLPKQIFFQCTRLANFYFICIGIPQTIPGFSTTGNFTTILPVAFFLVLTICKEGYDDLRRHRLDKVENNAFATVLRRKHEELSHTASFGRAIVRGLATLSRYLHFDCKRKQKTVRQCPDEKDPDEDEGCHWTKIKWHDIRVGDVVKLKRDEAVPADIALLSATGEDGLAYVDTMALDGETNLKSKQAPLALRGCQTIHGIKVTRADFVLEDPNRTLYDFNGRVTVSDKTVALTLSEVLLRGCVLRNTASAIGMVMTTGEECKIRMNANHHPKAKKPRLERYTNQVVLTLIFYVIVLSVGCSMGYLMWHQHTEVHSWYLNNSYVPFKQVIIGYIIMFNNVIPLALYVTLEIIKVGQMLMISGDFEMYDENTNTPMTCNTNTILENLGQVSYVLSDKTGTLTDNVMRFRGLSVAGTAWMHHSDKEHPEDRAQVRRSVVSTRKSHEQSKTGMAKEEGEIVVEEKEISAPTIVQQRASAQIGKLSIGRNSTDHRRQSFVQGTTSELLSRVQQHPDLIFSQKARDLVLAIALCHTALPEKDADGTIDFQASSPDELALVRAAQDLGMLVINRTTNSITLLETDCDGQEEHHRYEILNVIEFSSKRKRMSMIVRCPDGKIRLLCKGADSVIIPRLTHAALAVRKSQEVRRSIQNDREHLRKSGNSTPRNSFGGRPSLTIRRRSSMDIRPALLKRNTLEVPSFDYPRTSARRPSLDTRSSGRPSHDFLADACAKDDGLVFTKCFKHLDDFATDGLRTLVFACRTLAEDEYKSWKKLYEDATTSLLNRQERIETAGELIEQGLDLLGASAIEDKLQQGVPETIDKLRRANMKIWMLTGDKRETAINIAHAANICQPGSEVTVLDTKKGGLSGQLRTLAEELRLNSFHRVAVIDGQTLSDIEANVDLTNLFYSLVEIIDSVICCRASPAQKAGIVAGIRARMPGLTLAIGDGANDIAMITTSHVGIGISGKEGLQAARVADFSIAQFRFLQRLLLVHGRWNYVRTAKFILWTYWKEMFFYMVQASYQHYDGYTGSSLYENWSLTALNTLFTSLCVIIPGIFEQDLSAETLLAVPELYVHGQRNKELNVSLNIIWMALGAAQGLLVWHISCALYGQHNKMGDNGTFAIGNVCFSAAIMWTNTKLLIMEMHYKTRMVAIGFLITVSGWWAWNAFLDAAYSDNISPFDVKHGFSKGFGRDPVWWLTLVIVLAVLVTLELAWKAVRRNLAMAGRWPLWKLWRSRSVSKNAEELDLEVWKELERDPVVRQKLKNLACEGGVLEDASRLDMEELRKPG